MAKLVHQLSRAAANDLVGIQSRVEKLEKLLELGSDDVRFIGICGMSGIGKTILASAVYGKISDQFDISCFLTDVSRVSTDVLQLELLRETLQHRDSIIRDVNEGDSLICKTLNTRRTLIVLDDVDESEKLEGLVRNHDWFGKGSRIIITSIDEHILKVHGVDAIYKVELLNEDEALQLFCRKTFKCDYPKRGYEELTRRALEYATGLPLAIESLASLLLNRSIGEWKSALAKLQVIPDSSIMVLCKNFDRLQILEKQIFLDIACFFVGEKIDFVKEVLGHYGPEIEYSIEVLINKSFITVLDQRIEMHQMLQKLGRELVRQESPFEPGGRSRLWLYNDFRHVMENNTGSRDVKAIVLNQDDSEKTPLRAEALSEMRWLRVLILHNVNFSGGFTNLPREIRYLSWNKYPFTSLPEPDSHLIRPWRHTKMLFPYLTRINMRNSKFLIEMPNFRAIPNLKWLDLEGCIELRKLDPSIARLSKLAFLNLRNCKSLVSIPNRLFGLSSLETLNLAGCSNSAECLNLSPLISSLEVKLLSLISMVHLLANRSRVFRHR